MNHQTAKDLYWEYRMKTESSLDTYNRVKTLSPIGSFPKLAKQVWRVAMLAKIWGTIATKLSGGKVDYIANWRIGQ